MNWRNIKRLFVRELLGQLRDRRTIFTTVMLPVMIYPVLGLVMMQAVQFMSENSSKLVVVGEFQYEGLPELLTDEQKEDGKSSPNQPKKASFTYWTFYQ